MSATKYTAATFPIGSTVGPDDGGYSTYQKLRGTTVTGDSGKEWRLVQLNKSGGATAAELQKIVLKWNTLANGDVDVATAATDIIAGVGVDDQVAVENNGLFWVQIDGPTTVVDSGSGVSAGDLLSPTTGGEVLTGTAAVADLIAGRDVLTALVTASADADVTAHFTQRCVGKDRI